MQLESDTANSVVDVYKPLYILRRIWIDYLGSYKSKILIAVFAMSVSASCTALTVKLLQATVDQIFLTKDKKSLYAIPLFVLCVFSLKGVAEYFQNYFVKSTGQKVLNDIQMDLYIHLLNSDISLIYQKSSGRLVSSFANDISLMRSSVSNLITSIAKHFLSVLFLVAIMFKLDHFMAFFTFFIFPIAIFPVQLIAKKIRKIVYQTQENLSNYTSKLDEIFQSIKIVKSFQTEDIEHKRAKDFCNSTLKLYERSSKLDSIIPPIMEFLCGFVIAVIILYGGARVMDSKSTPGEFFAFIMAFISAYRPFKSLVSLAANLQEGIAASKRIFEVMDQKPKIQDKLDAIEINVSDVYLNRLAFENIFLSLNDKKVVDNINISINSNSIVSIVGKSGSGKTSLMNLLLRFYDPTEGKIFINDMEIRDISIKTLRSMVSIVSQESILFDDTIRNNIAYAKLDATHEEIVAAAKFSCSDEFIDKLPNKYDTKIGSNGFTLSGGQRQRLSIARSILKASPIMIFDETTNSLDNGLREKIMQNIYYIKQDRIIFIITHQILSIVNSDVIILMDSGTISAAGNHVYLMQNSKLYNKMYNNALEFSEN